VTKREPRNQNCDVSALYCKIPLHSCLLHLFTNCRMISPAVINIMKEVHIKLTIENTRCNRFKVLSTQRSPKVCVTLFTSLLISHPSACVFQRTTYAQYSVTEQHFTGENTEHHSSTSQSCLHVSRRNS
jgi:hypothetical protein